MPKVTRKSAAATRRAQTQKGPTRNDRPVFGDVSNNNSEGQKSSAASKAKRTSTRSTATTTIPTTRRRSSRLSGSGLEEIESTTISTTTTTTHPSETAPEGKGKVKESASANLAPRRTRSSRKTSSQEEEKLSNSSSPPNIEETSESSSEPNETEALTARPATRETRTSSKAKQFEDESSKTRLTRASKAKQVEDNEPSNQDVTKAKEATRLTRSTAAKRKELGEGAPIPAETTQRATTKQEDDKEMEEMKPPARKFRTSRAPSEPAFFEPISQVSKIQARKTRASMAAARDKAPQEDVPPANQAAQRTTRARSKGRQEQKGDEVAAVQEPVKKTRASRGRGGRGESTVANGRKAKDEEEVVAPPAATTRSNRSRAKSTAGLEISQPNDATTNDATTKPSRGRSRGRASAAAAKSEPPETTDDGPRRRSSRSTSRAATATTAKRTSTKGKEPGKKDTGTKKASSKRGRQGEQSQQPRKSARVGRSKSTSRSVARIKVSYPCRDFLPQDDFRLFRGELTGPLFDASKFTRGTAPWDLPNKDKVEEVTDYVTDIMQRLYEREVATRPHPYMQEQPNLNTNMRSILIDWLVEVHMKFRLEPATLYLCVNIIDRFLERKPTERSKLQLVGVTALLVACKIEEIYPPEVRDCVYICDKAYSRQEVLDMEAKILRTLEYSVTAPTGHPFLVRFLHITKATKLQKHAANYYMERMLQEYMCMKHRPSLIAASCVALALNNASIREHCDLQDISAPGVPNELLDYTGFDMAKILDVAEKVSSKVSNTHVTNSRRELVAVKKKYESSRYGSVATAFDAPDLQDILSAYD